MKSLFIKTGTLCIGLALSLYGFDYCLSIIYAQKGIKNILVIGYHIDSSPLQTAVCNQIKQHESDHLHIDVIDMTSFALPYITSQQSPLEMPIADTAITPWRAAIMNADACVWILPAHHGLYPGYFKNSVDLLWKEWHNKPTGVISYSIEPINWPDYTHALESLFSTVKADLVNPYITISVGNDAQAVAENLIDEQIQQKIGHLIDTLDQTARSPRYLKKIMRQMSDKLQRRIIKFFKHK